MTLLDLDRLHSSDPASFRNADPFPWVNPAGLLTDDAWARLRAAMPPVELFQPVFGKKRRHGQMSHDRYALEWDDNLPVDPVWHQFVAELRGPDYRRFLERMLGWRHFRLRFHWHYTPRGCSVSPHCDARDKLGSHIFYFSSDDDWDPSWGGETLILDGAGRFPPSSAPDFDAFARAFPADAMGNRSLLFQRTDCSWHGVRQLTSPEGVLRKVFIVVIDKPALPLVLVDRARALVAA